MNSGTYQGEYHPASPLIDFITEVARFNNQAVLDSGFLDMLLCMYVCNFSSGNPAFPYTQRLIDRMRSDRGAILASCTAALELLSETSDALAVISAHPVCILWPKNRTLLFQFGRRSNERHLQWRYLGTVVAVRRLAALSEHLLLPMTKKSDLSRLIDICVDIVEFSRRVTI
jgi:hypothetical protein